MSEGAARLLAGRYRLLRVLGRGGMGVVWHAHDEFLQRDVAVKEVHLPASVDMVETDPLYRRTLREARAAAKLRHPGIVTVHDVISDNGRPCIVMELVDGSSLAQLIREDGPVSPRRAADIGLRVAHALDAAHRKGILHRDVKPANILLDGDRAVLTDFGIAAIEGGTALTATNHLIGSPEYIAPEHIGGAEAGPPADLWALGVTLYAAVAGKSPFQRSDPQTTLIAIVTREPDPLPQMHDLWPVIEGLLRKDPAERLTIEQAVTMMTAAVTEPVAASAPSPVPVAVGAPPTATAIEAPEAQVTVAPGTAAKTRTAPPELPAPPARPTITPAKRTFGSSSIPLVLVILLIAGGMFYVIARVQKPEDSDPDRYTPPGYTRQDALGLSFPVPAHWRKLVTAPGVIPTGELGDDTVAEWQAPDAEGEEFVISLRAWPPGSHAEASAFVLDLEKNYLIKLADANTYRQEKLTKITAGTSGVSVADMTYHLRFKSTEGRYAVVRSVVRSSGAIATLEFHATRTGDDRQLNEYWARNKPTVDTVLRFTVVD